MGGSGVLRSEHSMGPIGQRRTDSGGGGIGVVTAVVTAVGSHRDTV